MNGHIDRDQECLENVSGSYSVGDKNSVGEMLLKFCVVVYNE